MVGLVLAQTCWTTVAAAGGEISKILTRATAALACILALSSAAISHGSMNILELSNDELVEDLTEANS